MTKACGAWLNCSNVVERRVSPPAPGHSSLETMTQEEYYEINAADNDEDVTKLVEHVAEQVDGVTIKMKEGGSIKITGGASITMTSGAIKIG